MAMMPASASSERSSMSVVRRYTSTSDRTRDFCGSNSDNQANAFDEVQQGMDAHNALDGPTTTVAQAGGEAGPMPVVTERPRRQKRRSLKLTVPSLRPGRRRSWSLPPIVASIAALQPKRSSTPPSPRAVEEVSSSPASPKRLWRVLKSSLRDPGSKEDIHTPASDAIPGDAASPVSGGPEGRHIMYCESPVSEYHSVASNPLEEPDIQLPFSLPGEQLIEDSRLSTLLELPTPRPSIGLDFQEVSSYAAEQKDLAPVDPAYRALLPIVYGLEEMTFNTRRRSLGEEYGDEDYTKFWETFGQLSAKEVLHAVYAIRSGALDLPIRSPSQRSDTSLLTTFCVLWAVLATMLALYFYLCSR